MAQQQQQQLTPEEALFAHVREIVGNKLILDHYDHQVAAYYLWEKDEMPIGKDLEHWFRAESASDPSNAALLAAYTVHGGPLNPPNRGPAPGLVTDQATIEAEAARAFAESQQRISTARGGAFGPAGAEVESIHAEDVPVWAKLVVGGDSSGGVDGGLPVWAQDIKDALPPSVLEQVAAGVKGQDSKKVKEALQSLTPAEKERLGETVRGIPPEIKSILEKTFAPSVHHYTMKKRRKYGPDRVLEWVKATVTQTTTDGQGSVVGVRTFEFEGANAEKTVEEISKMIEEGYSQTPTSSD